MHERSFLTDESADLLSDAIEGKSADLYRD